MTNEKVKSAIKRFEKSCARLNGINFYIFFKKMEECDGELYEIVTLPLKRKKVRDYDEQKTSTTPISHWTLPENPTTGCLFECEYFQHQTKNLVFSLYHMALW